MRQVRCPTTLRWPMNSLKVFGDRAICTSSSRRQRRLRREGNRFTRRRFAPPALSKNVDYQRKSDRRHRAATQLTTTEAARRLQLMCREIASTQEAAKGTGGETMRRQGL